MSPSLVETPTNSRLIGNAAEDRAADFFVAGGWEIVCRNFNTPMGEIDLIVQNDTYFVFVEVRDRADASHGDALESITPAKQRRIALAALSYLTVHPETSRDIRFDVIAIDGGQLEWIQGAFNAPDRYRW